MSLLLNLLTPEHVSAPPSGPPTLRAPPNEYANLSWGSDGVITTTITGFEPPSLGDRLVVCWSTGADRNDTLISGPAPTITDNVGNLYTTHASYFRTDIGFDHSTISSCIVGTGSPGGIPTDITYDTNATGPNATNAGTTAIFIYVMTPAGIIGATGGFGEFSGTTSISRSLHPTPAAVQMEQDSISLACLGVYAARDITGSIDGITWLQESTITPNGNWMLRRTAPTTPINVRPEYRVPSDTNYAGCFVDFRGS